MNMGWWEKKNNLIIWNKYAPQIWCRWYKENDFYLSNHNKDKKIAAIVPKTELPFKKEASALLVEEMEETSAEEEEEEEMFLSAESSEPEVDFVEDFVLVDEDLVDLEVAELEEDFLALALQV